MRDGKISGNFSAAATGTARLTAAITALLVDNQGLNIGAFDDVALAILGGPLRRTISLCTVTAREHWRPSTPQAGGGSGPTSVASRRVPVRVDNAPEVKRQDFATVCFSMAATR